MSDYQKASNDYDMLKGCVNRIFVTDDKEELISLYTSAIHYLSLIFLYGKERFSERSENPCKDCKYFTGDGFGCSFNGPCPHQL